MVKRTYTTEQAGTASTNRFVQRTYTPTRVVTGATTNLANIKPNTTGKRKPTEINQESSGGSPVSDPTPVDFASLTNEELSNMANSGFPGGLTSPGSIATGAISAAIPGAGFVTLVGRGLNKYGAKQEIKARLMTPGLRDKNYTPNNITFPSDADIGREMKNRNQRVTLADRGYGTGGDGLGDAVGAHPDTDDLGPDSAQGDTEATWGG